jgi:hypothetical protein
LNCRAVNAQPLLPKLNCGACSTLREAISGAARFPWLPPVAKLMARRAPAPTPDTCQAARRANHCPTASAACPAPFEKIFCFSEYPNHFIFPAILFHSEGRFANVTNAGRGAVDVAARLTGDANADGEDVWS